MATGKSSAVCSAGVIDIICGTLQAKLLTNDLSSGSSCCIQFLLSPCEFQHQVGKATAKNWESSIRYQGQPLSRALESVTASDGKHRFFLYWSLCSFRPGYSPQFSTTWYFSQHFDCCLCVNECLPNGNRADISTRSVSIG